MGNSPEIELYLPMTTYQYYSAGAIDDLSQYPDIMQHMEAYREDQFNSIMIDGAFLAVPEFLNPTAWKANACTSVLRSIEKAQKEGRRDTCFDPRPCEQYEAVKREFENHGYVFRPTGYIGGVWQRTEHICW